MLFEGLLEERNRVHVEATCDFDEFEDIDAALAGFEFPNERIRASQFCSKFSLRKSRGLPCLDNHRYYSTMPRAS